MTGFTSIPSDLQWFSKYAAHTQIWKCCFSCTGGKEKFLEVPVISGGDLAQRRVTKSGLLDFSIEELDALVTH